jgi:hypothetical protein
MMDIYLNSPTRLYGVGLNQLSKGTVLPLLMTLWSGLKRPKCEADYSSLSIAVVKNAWSYTTVPHASSQRGA